MYMNTFQNYYIKMFVDKQNNKHIYKCAQY